ncbi:phosphoenolpyruvate carboxykinase [uncultured Bacteroides sp.]|jgi:hypothetical protein|uniref:phosphoenolpyruvate carboxykinase n=1 Tax=uncultured Bacteroides sp. TaxID=162156 RepID=UPI00280BDF01|nr:phosphoenolpyruvate carboxykinase [uncultured Bacteroides sp.]
MSKDYYFQVAGFTFNVRLCGKPDIERLLPSFRSFLCDGSPHEKLLFYFVETPVSDTISDRDVLLEDNVNDMGRTRLWRTSTGYRIELRFMADGTAHYLYTDPYFTFVKAKIDWNDSYVGEVLSSMLRIVFSQAVIYYGGISVHAATVVLDGKAYLFMGKSGTGKSTHAALWQECFPGCELLNDDNPTIRIANGKAIAYGTPWSGKTPCYKNLCYPIGGIVRLSQAKENRFTLQENVDAFITVLPGCSGIRQNSDQYGELCDTLARLVCLFPVGKLECLPDRQAAVLCKEKLKMY